MAKEKKEKKKHSNYAKHLTGHQWKPGQSGNPAGKPRSVMTKIRELIGEEIGKVPTKNQINEMMGSLMILTSEQLRTLSKHQETPIVVKNFAVAILADINDGKTPTINTIFDRLHGKPKQSIEQDVKTNVILGPPEKPNQDGKLVGLDPAE